MYRSARFFAQVKLFPDAFTGRLAKSTGAMKRPAQSRSGTSVLDPGTRLWGRGRAQPRSVVLGLMGRDPDQATLPRMIRAAQVLIPAGGLRWELPASSGPALGEVSPYLESAPAREYVQHVPGATLKRGYGGTLSGLEPWSADTQRREMVTVAHELNENLRRIAL